MKTLIVDDERLARARLRTLLAPHSDVAIVAEANSVESAIAAIAEHQPNIVFLDISMPGESGFDLLSIQRVDAAIVFVTAHDEHALRAFEVGALDYLLKPVEPQRLSECLDRVRSRVGTAEISTDRISLSSGADVRLVRVTEIALVRSKGDYTELVFADDQVVVRSESMAHWEKRLGASFFRTHRSALVALDRVERVEKSDGSASQLFLTGRSESVPVSRARVTALKAALLDRSRTSQ